MLDTPQARWQRNNKEKTNAKNKKWRRTKSGFLQMKYHHMKGRVEGRSGRTSHLYKGLYLLDKEEFISKSLSDSSFNKLYASWVASGYSRRLVPSPDRIDSIKGYSWDNIKWVTWSENARAANKKRWDKEENKIPEGMSKCGKCQEVKGIDLFHKSRERKRGVNGHCKECCHIKYIGGI